MPMPFEADSGGAIDAQRAALLQRQGALDQSVAARQAQGDQAMQGAQEGIAQGQGDVAALTAQGPAPTAMPKPPGPAVDPKDMQGFTSMLLAMAAIGGATSGGNWIGVAGTLTGALKGYNEGNKQAATDAYERYKTEFAAAKNHEEQANKEFDRVLKSKELSINQKITQYKILAAKYDRQDAWQAASQKSIDKMWEQLGAHQMKIDKLNERHQAWTAKLEKQISRDRAMQEMRNADREQRADAARMAHEDRQAAQEGKGWQIVNTQQGPMRVNASTGEAHAFDNATGEWKKLGGGGGSGAPSRMQNVVRQDVDNGFYNFDRLMDISQTNGEMVAGSTNLLASMDKVGFVESLTDFLKQRVLGDTLGATDALLLNLAFDIASAQSGGSALVAYNKIQEIKHQLPLVSMSESVKRERYAALIHRLKTANSGLPKDQRLPPELYEAVEKYFGVRGLPAKGPTSSQMEGDPKMIFADITNGKYRDAKGKEYTPSAAERRKVLQDWLQTPGGQAYSEQIVQENLNGATSEPDFGVKGNW
jgi:hypothetical protein